MSNFFIAIAVFVITVIGALFAVPYFIDWNGYRGAFEEEATRLLGREVRVGGAVNLHLLPTPYFRFEKVRIADNSVNQQDAFFRAESLTIKLSVPPIFRGVVEANEIELQRPTLRFALDKDDGWNWQSFGQVLGDSAYLPSTIALSSVKIADGVLAVHTADGAERTRFEGLNGELSTPALVGPYRFRGTFGKGRAEREVKIATARPEPDGSVRFKAMLRPLDGASTYTLDGRVADLAGKPRVEGELTARLPIAELWQAPSGGNVRAKRPETGIEDETKSDRGEAAFDVKAQVSISPAGATLSDLALAFEQDGRPQLVTGELKALWREGFAVEMSLASHWLDLDRIAGAGERAGPLDTIIPLAIGMRDLLPGETRSRATFSIDQANVGHEAVSGLRLSLARTHDKLEIETLRLAMPGGSRGELQGAVSGPSDAPVFEGSLSLRGSSLVRFLGWATANALSFDAKGDGTFGVRSQLSIAPGRAAANSVVGDLSGTTIYGSVRYRWEGRPELSLVIDSPQLDARPFIPAGASLGDIAQLVLQGPPAAGQTATPGLATAKPGWRSGNTDALVRVNAGQIITAARTYRDVGVDLELKGGRLSLPQLRVAGDDGFSLELEGGVDDAASRPKGSLRGVVAADTTQGVAALAELLGIPEAFRPNAGRAQAMLPLRVAGSISLGVRQPASADVVLGGEANGAGINLNARFDGSPTGWRTGPADLTGVIEAADAGAIAALLAPGRVPPARPGNAASGRLLVRAVGVPAEGLATLASVDAGDLGLSFRGQFVAGDGGNRAAGELEIKAADGTRLAQLAGLAPPLRLDGVPVAGTLKLAVDGKTMAFDRLGLSVGGSDVKGQIALTAAGDRRRVEARLDVDEISLARLLAPLLDQRLAVAAAAEAAVAGRQSAWPDEPFDASILDGFEGSIHLDSKRFVLADGIGLGRASIDIALSGGKVDVKQIDGACLGGRCSASVRIDKVPAGVEISGELRVTGAKLQALAGDAGQKPSATGALGGEIKFTGKGTSPRAVLSVLQGSGTLTLGNARLATLWPGAIGVAAEAALQADPDNLAKVLKQALGVGFAGGQLPLPASVGIDIADGQLGAKPFAIDTAEGRASGGASLDLKTLAFEADWRLEQKPGGPGSPSDKPVLPAVTVSYRGPIAALGAIEPSINTEALERELTVRRMERDVEELERLRRLDETRRRDEAERQRRQFEQTAPPPPAVPPPGPVPMAPAVPQPRPATPG